MFVFKYFAVVFTLNKITASRPMLQITPEKLLETSRQKIEREEMKQKRRISLTTISLAPGKDADAPGPFGNPDANDEFSNGNSSFGVPSHDAFKSFFKVKEQDQVDSQPVSICVSKLF